MFILHAGVSAKDGEREKLEHLARYIARSPIATGLLALTEGSHIWYPFKSPYRDGTTHVILEPMVPVPIERNQKVAINANFFR